MKHILLSFFVVLLFSASSLPKKKQEIKCKKQTEKFAPDDIVHLNSDALLFDTKTGLAYTLSNDDRNLYVQLKMLHADVQRKALLTGFTLWIDPNGKGKHVLGIVYPQGRTHRMQAMRQQGNMSRGAAPHRTYGQKPTPEQLRMLNERLASEIPDFKGFKKIDNGNPAGVLHNVKLHLRMDTLGHLLYSAVIPLRAIFLHPEDYLKKDQPFSLTFETGYLQMDMSRMQGHGPGGGRGQGMGMGGGGQRSGSGRMAFMQSMAEPSRLKLKTVRLYPIK